MPFRLKKILIDVKEKLALNDPILIVPYIGYASDKLLYCKGRVIENEGEEIKQNDSVWKNFINSLKRIETDEIPFVNVGVNFREQHFRVKTNKEGFYTVERRLKTEATGDIFEPIQISISENNVPAKYAQKEVSREGMVLIPAKTARYGVISDIDDTMLKTDVLSSFKWKTMYYTMFIKAADRMPIHFVNNWYKKMEKGLEQDQNPFFYISHSPWNLYDYLQMFLSVHKFPKGPTFLRDYGLRDKEGNHIYYHHKRIEIERILHTYPDMQFVLIGDGAERDPKIYLDIHERFPNRVKAIFIRIIGTAKNRQKLAALAAENPDILHLIKTGRDGMRISRALGLIV